MGVHSSLYNKQPSQQQVKSQNQMLELAKKFCSDSGGYGLVSDRYAFIDLTRYNVTLKEDGDENKGSV